MIYNITEQFFSYSASNSIRKIESNHQKSSFLQMSKSLAIELNTLKLKLKDLETLILKSGRLNKQQHNINNAFIQIKEYFKDIDLKIKKINVIQNDMKAERKIKQQFKTSIKIILESRFIEMTLNYKRLYDQIIQVQKNIKNRKSVGREDKTYTQKSHFLQLDQQTLMQQKNKQQYKEIQKGILEITEMYKHISSMLKLQQLYIQKIQNNTTQANAYVKDGNKHLSNIDQGQKQNRNLIIKVFIILYIFVFIYINILL